MWVDVGYRLVACGNDGDAPHSSMAQPNPYRLGSPHYWMAETTLDINAGKLDVAYTNLQKAAVGYKNIGDAASEVNALGVYDMIGNVAEWTISGSSPLFFVAGRSFEADIQDYEVDSYEINHSEVKTPSLGLRLVYVPEKSK